MAWVCGKQGCPGHSQPSHRCQGWKLAAITGSVGRGGQNRAADVTIVQGALNQFVGKPGGPAQYLATDGSVGEKTIAAIAAFQAAVVRVARPDGRVDPGGRTFGALSGKGTVGPAMPPVTSKLPPKAQAHLADMQRAMTGEKARYWKEFEDEVSRNASIFLGIVGQLEGAMQASDAFYKMAQFWVVAREWGLATSDIVEGWTILATRGIVGDPSTVRLVEAMVTPSSKLAKLLPYVKKAGTFAALIGILLTTAIAWRRGDYHIIAVEAYKFALSCGVPVLGILDAIQGLIGAIWPGTNTGRVFKYIRVVNPIGLQGIAIDSVGTLIQTFIAKGGSEQRLARLVDRMKEGGAYAFVEIGEDLGDAVFVITQMSEAEFSEMFTAKNVVAWLKSLVASG